MDRWTRACSELSAGLLLGMILGFAGSLFFDPRLHPPIVPTRALRTPVCLHCTVPTNAAPTERASAPIQGPSAFCPCLFAVSDANGGNRCLECSST